MASSGKRTVNPNLDGGDGTEAQPGPVKKAHREALVSGSTVSFALFGLGRAGSIHANNILEHERAVLRYIVELDVDKAQAFVAQKGLEGTTEVVAPDRMGEIMALADVEAVMVASTTSTHEAIIRCALQHGKPVFSEKPIAETVDATLAVCSLAAKTGTLFCGFNRRSDDQFLAMYERVRAGEIGRILTLTSTSRDAPDNCPIEYIKISGGQFADQSVHDVDIALWMIGERPVEVVAYGHAFYDDIAAVPDTDTVMIMLKFPSGAMAHINNTRRATFGYDTRLEVYGDEALLTLENVRPSAVTLHGPQGEQKGRIYDHFRTRFRDAYRSELNHFIEYLQGKVDTLRITAQEAYAAVRVSQAAAESYKTGKTVTLTWDD